MKCKIPHDKGELQYHKNLHTSGEEWYDFSMLTFEDNMCPAYIHGFFQRR